MPTDDYEDDDQPRRPRNSRGDDDDRPRRRRDEDDDDRPRRRRDEDDDYDDAPRRSGGSPHHGVIILVLGILGLCCGLSGLVAFIWGLIELGKMNKSEIDSSGKGMVMAGTIIGIIGFVLNCAGGIYFRMHPNAFR